MVYLASWTTAAILLWVLLRLRMRVPRSFRAIVWIVILVVAPIGSIPFLVVATRSDDAF